MALTAHAEALWLQLEPLLPGLSVEVLPQCASTNTTLLERARGGDTAPCLLVAEAQTQGRGRLGRSWTSKPGASLTFSLALPYAPLDWSGLSLAVGLCLADALDPSGQRIALKWPNDLWLRSGPGRGRKLGGILIETVVAAGQRVAVIGIGINVLAQPDAGLTHGLAALLELDTGVTTASALVAVAAPLLHMLRRFESEGFGPLAARYAVRDLLRRQHVLTTQAGVPEGVAEGVDAQGALLVRAGVGADVGTGSLHRISSGEVSIRLQAATVTAD